MSSEIVLLVLLAIIFIAFISVAVAAFLLRRKLLAWAYAKSKSVIADAVAQGIRRSAQDIRVPTRRHLARQSGDFATKIMGLPPSYLDRFDLLSFSLSCVDSKLKHSGIYCEFGVFRGATINHIASRVQTTVHGFDSFEGLPTDWRAGWGAGSFAIKQLPKVRANVKLHQGWFKDILPSFIDHHPEPLAFAHFDAVLYSSPKEVLDAIGPRIVAGTVLQFDEFLNYPGWREGEAKAFLEFCEERSAEVEYLGYVADEQQVSVRIKKIAPCSERKAPEIDATVDESYSTAEVLPIS